MKWNKSKEVEKECDKKAYLLFGSAIRWNPKRYKDCHDGGWDAIIKNKKVDLKYCLPTVYKWEHEIFIEKEQLDRSSWLEGDDDIIIAQVVFREPEKVVVKAYPLSWLKKLDVEKLNSSHPVIADTRTTGWYVADDTELKDGEVDIGQREVDWETWIKGGNE